VASADSWWDDLVRDRFGAVLERVTGVIADDYESVETILWLINQTDRDPYEPSGAGRGVVPVSRPEVIKALRELTLEGYAETYVLDPQDGDARPAQFNEYAVDHLWFYATAKGRQAVKQP